MTIRWGDAALQQLQRWRSELPNDVYLTIVRRVVLLETDASTFEASFDPVTLAPTVGDLGALKVHVFEAGPAHTAVLLYRLSLVDEDIWIVRIGIDK